MKLLRRLFRHKDDNANVVHRKFNIENCKWCGYPEETHTENGPGVPHEFEVSVCTDPWHGEIQGWGAECSSCRMIVFHAFMFMRRAIIPGKASKG